MQRGRPWGLRLADRVPPVATCWRTNLRWRQGCAFRHLEVGWCKGMSDAVVKNHVAEHDVDDARIGLAALAQRGNELSLPEFATKDVKRSLTLPQHSLVGPCAQVRGNAAGRRRGRQTGRQYQGQFPFDLRARQRNETEGMPRFLVGGADLARGVPLSLSSRHPCRVWGGSRLLGWLCSRQGAVDVHHFGRRRSTPGFRTSSESLAVVRSGG